MKVEKERNGEQLKVKVIGSIDANTDKELLAQLDGELEGVSELRFDMTDMDYISSAGLRAMLEFYQTIADNNGKMALDHVREDLLEIFKLTKFTDFIEIS